MAMHYNFLIMVIVCNQYLLAYSSKLGPSKFPLQLENQTFIGLNEDVRYAGTVEGKTFFAITGAKKTWFESSVACKNMNMKLAELTSQTQATVITSFVNSSQITNSYYWVGGRDARVLRQFSWDSTNVDVSGSGIRLAPLSTFLYQTCLVFRPLGFPPDPDYPYMSFYITECELQRDYLCEASASILNI